MSRRKIYFVLLVCFIGWIAGCTSVPQKEFAAYRQAFQTARTSGEEVLLDFSLAQKEYQSAGGVSGEGIDNSSSSSTDRFAFDIQEAIQEETVLDPVGVRMQAWRVLDQYNEVLAVLAAGGSQAKVSAAVDGLLGSLKTFPIEEISEVALEAIPYADIAKAALEILEEEIAARRFVQSVQAVRPEMLKFLLLLENDAQNFYNIRLGLYHLKNDELNDAVFDLYDDAGQLLGHFYMPSDEDAEPDSDAVAQAITQINRILVSVPDWPGEEILMNPETGDPPVTMLVISQLNDITRQIGDLRKQIISGDEAMAAYRDMLTQYVRMIHYLRVSIQQMSEAIVTNQQAPAVAHKLFTEAVKLRKAVALYEKAR